MVGHGMVGQRVLESVVERDPERRLKVLVFAEEPRRAYDRVRLSSYFAGATPDDLTLAPEGFFAEHGIELRLGEAVTAVDRARRTVTTATGATVGYDTLVLATGSYPFVPPVPGRDAAGCFVYRTVDDVRAIEAY